MLHLFGLVGVGRAGVRIDKITSHHGAQGAHIADASIGGFGFMQMRHQTLAQDLGAGRQLFFGHDVEHRMRRSDGQGVTGIGAPQASGVGRVHDGAAANDGGQGGATAHALGQGHQIGGNTVVLHGKHLAGAGKTGLHFVGNQHDAVFIAQGAQPLHRLGLDGVETALALHRLKNNRRHTAGLDVALEQLLHRFLRFL